MVKSYSRYELNRTIGVIASHSNSIFIGPDPKESKKSAGRIITAGLEEILVWDIKTGEVLRRLRDGVAPGSLNSTSQNPPAQVTSLAHEPITNVLASGYADGSIKIWDLTSGVVLINFQGHRSAVSLLKFDRSGTRLISGSRDTTAILWDLVGETGLFKLEGHRDQITGIEFLSATDKTGTDEIDDWLLTTSKDGMIKLWDLKAKQCIETHVAHSGECWALGVNSTKNLCLTCGMDNQVKLWKIDLAQKNTKIIEQGSFEKQSKRRGIEIGFHTTSQGEFFYISNADKMCELFRFRTEKEMKKATAKRTKRLQAKGLSEEEININIKEATVSMLIAPFTVIYAERSKIRSTTWGQLSDRKLDITLSLTNNTLSYYTVTVPEVVRKHKLSEEVAEEKYILDRLGHRHDIRAVDISDDDALIVTGSNNQLKVWNSRTGNCIRTFEKTGYVLSAKLLPGGSLVMVGTKDGYLHLLDLATSTVLDSIDDAHDGKAIWSIDISPDGKTIVTGSADKTVKFWEIKVTKDLVPGTTDKYVELLHLNHIKTLELTDDVLSVRISPDGKYLAAALMDNTVKVFFYDTLKFYLSLYGHKLPVLSIDISYDSKTIITSSADKNIRIWGLDFGDCHRSIFGHQDAIMCVKFFPDSKNFVSCSKDGMVKTWDGDKFQNVQKLAVHQSEVWSLAMSHSGEFFVTVSHDSSIRIWKETDDQVFLQEEREKEMDETYEDELISSLEGGNGDDMTLKKKPGLNEEEDENDEEQNKITRVSRQTMEKLKAGEKLMEALELSSKQMDEFEKYEDEMQKFKHGQSGILQPTKPETNALLQALNKSPEDYVLEALVKIKAAQLDDALLVLPFSYSLKLLKFIKIWTDPKQQKKNNDHIARICRTLFFITESNHMELISQKDPKIKMEILDLKDQLREILQDTKDKVGLNLAGLKFIQEQWNQNHSHVFDETKPQEAEESHRRKRVYTTLA